MFNIVILGSPGCGKGTQSANIVRKYGLTHISTGNILREEIEIHSTIGKIVKNYIDKGYLVPDDIMMEEVVVSAFNFQNSSGLLFDGFPRTMLQAEYLDDILNIYVQKIALVLHLEVSENELYNRILHRSEDSMRTDDNVEVVKNRLEVYYKHTYPLLDYYSKQKKLVTISGMSPVNEVFLKIASAIDSYL